MNRLKRMQFWGEDANDDRLIVEIIEGKKTATACGMDEYCFPSSEYDDGGWKVGDVVEVYDLQKRLRCKIEITEVYKTLFGSIPEKLWKEECFENAEHFREEHRRCWPEYDLKDDFEMMAIHFKLVEVIS